MARNGTGVRKASENSIQIEFLYNGERCRERIKIKPSAANLRRAELHRQQILDAIETGTFDYATTFPNSKHARKFSENPDLTVGKWLDTWLDRKEKHIKASTYTGYAKAINKLKHLLGHIPLSELKKRDVREWCEQQTCTNKSIANMLSPLRSALQEALDDELINENPLYNFSFRRNEPPKKTDIDPFTRNEQLAILDALNGQHKHLIQFALWTGLRTSELVGLEWDDVDWIRGTVLIQRAKTQYSRKPETTKTRSGNREVKLLEPALAALQAQKQFTFLEGQRIFKNPNTNKNWDGDQQIRKFWKWALKRAGVRYRRPYQTRHTYASMMLSAGEPLAWVSKQLGHSTVTMTAKAYATWIPDSQPEAGNKAVNLFASV